MGLRGVTQELYEQLVTAFRALPGNASGGVRQAALASKCDQRTAKKGWEAGFARGWHGARRPISAIIADEQEMARCRLAEQQDVAQQHALEVEAVTKAETRQKALRDATDTRTEEGRVVRLLRGNTLAALSNIARLNQALQKAVIAMQSTVEDMVAPDPVTGRPRALSLGEMRGLKELVATTTSSLSQAAAAANRAMEAERLLMGEPTKIIGLQVEDMTWSEARRRVNMAQRAMARLVARGIIVDGDPSFPAFTGDNSDLASPLEVPQLLAPVPPLQQEPSHGLYLSTLGTSGAQDGLVASASQPSALSSASALIKVRSVG